MSTSPAISTPVKQISPSPIDACMSPTANIPPGWRTGKKIRALLPCQWSSRFPPCGPPARSRASRCRRDADDADQRNRRERDAVVHLHDPVADLEQLRQRGLHEAAELAEAGDQSRNAPLDRPHVEDLHDEGVTGLCAPHCDGAGGAVDPGQVDRDEIVSRRICPEKQSFVSKVTTSPGSTRDRLEIGAEGPDDLVPRDAMARHSARHSVSALRVRLQHALGRGRERSSFAAGRTGRRTKSPPQFGQMSPKTFSAQSHRTCTRRCRSAPRAVRREVAVAAFAVRAQLEHPAQSIAGGVRVVSRRRERALPPGPVTCCSIGAVRELEAVRRRIGAESAMGG